MTSAAATAGGPARRPGRPSSAGPAARFVASAARLFVPAASLVAAAMLLAAGPARAQHGFVPPEDRALHQRLAAARVVAVATVARVDDGRIAFESVTPVVGRVEPELEMKRAPSKPPPWTPGDRVVLLLAGARSPYRWVEKPVEAFAPLDAEAEPRVVAALRAMDAARVDPVARRDLYARWADGADEALAAAGQRGLLDVAGMAGALDAEFARERAEVARDPARPLDVRRRAARVAARHPEGVAALLRQLGSEGHEVDREIAEVAFQGALIVRDPEVEARLAELLDAPEGELAQLAFRFAALAGGTRLERKLSELAVGHPEASVRESAVQALQNLRRTRTQRGGTASAPTGDG